MNTSLPFPTDPVLERSADDAPLRVGFCVSGGGRLFRAAVENTFELGIEPAYLLLDRNASRDVEDFAAKRSIATRRLTAPNLSELHNEMTSRFDEAEADFWALTFDKILPPSVIIPRSARIVNVHMALLPTFAGLHGIRQTLAHGARFGGATLHEVDEHMDHGSILAQCGVSLLPGDDEASAGARIWPLLRATYLQVLAWYSAGRVRRDEAGRLWIEHASYHTWPISPAIELPASVAGVS